MHGVDRLIVVGLGVAIISAIAVGTCSTHAHLDDLEANLNEGFDDLEANLNEGFSVQGDLDARFAEEAEQRRQEHRRIEERLDRLIDTLLRRRDPGGRDIR